MLFVSHTIFYKEPNTAKAIAWTLIHSLWIGLLFAAVAGLIVTLSKKSSARVRYHLLCATLMAFVAVMIYTLLREISLNSAATATTAGVAFGPIRTIVQQSGFMVRFIMFLNQQSAIIFLVWAIFFMLKSVQLTGGVLYIRKIRTRNITAVPALWQHKLKDFCTKISISKPVTLLQSELVNVPVAIGWLKPVILVPVGMICQLSPEQVESILLHELAHISRQDYLVNMMQGVVEAVFFFNPALLWLSSLIRQEREACCDDLVLAHISRKSDYLEALLAMGSKPCKVNLAMSLSAGSNQLKNRLKRMIYLENQKLSFREIFSLLLGIIFITAFTILPKAEATIQQHIATPVVKGDYLKAAGYNARLYPSSAKRSTAPRRKKLTEQEESGMKMYGQEVANYQDMLTQIDQSMQGPNLNSSKRRQTVKDTASVKQMNTPQALRTDSLSSNSFSTGKKLNHQSELSAVDKDNLKGIIDEAKKRVE